MHLYFPSSPCTVQGEVGMVILSNVFNTCSMFAAEITNKEQLDFPSPTHITNANITVGVV